MQVLALVGPGDRGYMGRAYGTPLLRSGAMAPGMNSEVITSCRADGPLIWRVQVLHGWDMVAFVGQVGNLMSRAYGTPPLRSRATAPGMNSSVVTGCRAVGPLKRLCRCCIGGACRTYATGAYLPCAGADRPLVYHRIRPVVRPG